MSRFILGDCVRVMATFPGNAVDFILTDPPYLVGFRDRQGRTIAGDKTDEWLQPACNGLRLGNGKYCTLRLFFVLTDINCSQRTILPFSQLLIVFPDIVPCQINVLPAQRRQM